MLVLAQSSCFGSHCVNLWQMLAKSVTVESPRLVDSAGKADLSYPLESAGLFLNSWCLRCSLDQLIRISRGGTQPSGVLKSLQSWEQLHRRVRANTQQSQLWFSFWDDTNTLVDTAKPESVLVITAIGAATGIWGRGVGVRDIKCLLHLVEQSFTMINDKSPRYMQVCVCGEFERHWVHISFVWREITGSVLAWDTANAEARCGGTPRKINNLLAYTSPYWFVSSENTGSACVFKANGKIFLLFSPRIFLNIKANHGWGLVLRSWVGV